MEALVINLNDSKRTGFKIDRTAEKGPMKLKDFHNEISKEKDRKRAGGRDRYDDRRRGGGDRYGGGDDRYYKKSNKNFDRRDKYSSSKQGSRYSNFERYDDDGEYTKKNDSKK